MSDSLEILICIIEVVKDSRYFAKKRLSPYLSISYMSICLYVIRQFLKKQGFQKTPFPIPVLIRFVHVDKKYKTRVGDRQRKSEYCGILAQKASVRTYVRPRSFIKLIMLMFTSTVLTAYGRRIIHVTLSLVDYVKIDLET